MKTRTIVLFFFYLFQALSWSQTVSSLPLCRDSTAPSTLRSPLSFCRYNGRSCCDAKKDEKLQKRFEAMNISDSSCASVVQSILCSECDPFSANLFKSVSQQTFLPILCNSTLSNNQTNGFCRDVWISCQNVPILNSPFEPMLQGGAKIPATDAFSKLTNHWQSETQFCKTFGGSSSDVSLCFNGQPVSLSSKSSPPSNGMCLEKIGNEQYLNMVPHPDGSNRVFLSNQAGKIWLASIPEQQMAKGLDFDPLKPFLDITDEVKFDSTHGLMGMAFHPDFVKNGRFFVSYNCDKENSTNCYAICACNTDVKCDPSQLGPVDGGNQPCQYNAIIAEYTANGSSSDASTATEASPKEVRRIFGLGLPYASNHGGQILFGPIDKYLYFMMGDGGNRGDPFNFAQKKNSLLGKIMRFDVDRIQTNHQWGNYSIPKDNPISIDRDLLPEIWASGFRNPWRCSFDSQKPSYLMCSDIGEDNYEEVNVVTKNGNYGWPIYEGPKPYEAAGSPGGNTSASSIDPIFSVMGYAHSDVTISKSRSAAITGGYVYRSMTDPCLYGKYLYADGYGSYMWQGIENPVGSGNFSSHQIHFKCAQDSPLPCGTVSNTSSINFGYIFSYGEDNKKDVYILALNGVFRVVQPGRCDFACSIKGPPNETPSSPSSSSPILMIYEWKFVSAISFILIFLHLLL